MPVARETTSAISSAPTWVRSSLLRRRLGFAAVGLLQLRFQLRQLAVLQLGHLLPVALALGFFHLQADLFDFFLDVGAALHRRLLGLPDFFQVGVFALEFADLFLDQRQALLRGFVLFLLHRFALDLQLDHAAVELVHHFRLGIDLDLDLGGGFVDQVDRLVRQEAVGDVAVRQFGRGDDGRVGDVDAMVHFVFFLQAAQDGDGRFHARLVHQDFLEAALQRGILLDVLAVFVQGGGADAVQFAARQRGLEHVAGVDGALGLAGADHGVQLVDEDDGLPFILGQFLQHRFQALLEFAAVLGAGQQRRHVQRQHALGLEAVRHFAVDDALRQAFDDGGLAHAGFADQHRVVLGAALQHLDGAADFVVAADHRVELALTGALGEVERVFFQRLALAFAFLRIDVAAAAHGVDRGFQRLARQAVFARQPAGIGLVLGQAEQDHFAGDELVAALLRFLVGQVQERGQFAPHLHFAAGAGYLGQALQRALQGIGQAADVDAGALQERPGAAVVLVQQGHQQVDRFDVLVVVADRQALGIGKGFLQLGCQFI